MHALKNCVNSYIGLSITFAYIFVECKSVVDVSSVAPPTSSFKIFKNVLVENYKDLSMTACK